MATFRYNYFCLSSFLYLLIVTQSVDPESSTKGDRNYWTPDQVRSDVTKFFASF